MKIFGIDYSLNGTGLSIYDGVSIIFKKVFTNVAKNYESDKNTFILSPKFKSNEEKIDWVVDTIINCHSYDFVCMEDHIGAYYDWMDGYAIIKHYLRKKNIPYLMIAPCQLKKYAGDGKADKNKMTEYLNIQYGFNFDEAGKLANNIVDATWLTIVGHDYYRKFIQKDNFNLTPERLKILWKLHEKQEKVSEYSDKR